MKILSKLKRKKAGKREKLKKVKVSAQKTLPFKSIYENGVIQVTKNLFSSVYEIQNVDYLLKREAGKEDILDSLGKIYNSMNHNINFQWYLENLKVDGSVLEETMLVKNENDQFIEDFNKIQRETINRSLGKTAERKLYIVLSVESLNGLNENVLVSLNKAYKNLSIKFKKLKANMRMLDTVSLIEVLYRFYNLDNYSKYGLKLPNDLYTRNVKVQDYIAPQSFRFRSNHVEMGELFNRTLFIRDYPSTIDDNFINDLLDNPYNLKLSMHIKPIAISKANRLVKSKITSMEMKKQDYKKKNKKEGTDYVPFDLINSLEQTNQLYDEMENKNKRMFEFGLYINITTDSLEELNEITDTLKSICDDYSAILDVLTIDQEDAMASVIPIGYNKQGIQRPLLTDRVSIFMPFSMENIFHDNGFNYGLNKINNSIILFDRKQLQAASGFILGIPGSGKSFASKLEMINAIENTDDDIICIDPQGELLELVKNRGGEIIDVSASGNTYLNPLEMNTHEVDGDPIRLKCDFVLTILETIKGDLKPKEKNIADRCVKICFKDYINSNYTSKVPNLTDFYNTLLQQPEPEAQDLALDMELYITGSLDMFAKDSNINLKNRITSFNIANLGKQLNKLGLLVVLENILNIVAENRKKNKWTWVYADEFYILFDGEGYTADYFYTFYKQCRKLWGIPTGITQNVTDLLKSDKACTMLSNSPFVMIMNQSPTDLEILKKLFKLNETQASYISNVDPGDGVIILNNDVVIPFESKVSKDNVVYKLLSTKPGESHL